MRKWSELKLSIRQWRTLSLTVWFYILLLLFQKSSSLTVDTLMGVINVARQTFFGSWGPQKNPVWSRHLKYDKGHILSLLLLLFHPWWWWWWYMLFFGVLQQRKEKYEADVQLGLRAQPEPQHSVHVEKPEQKFWRDVEYWQPKLKIS